MTVTFRPLIDMPKACRDGRSIIFQKALKTSSRHSLVIAYYEQEKKCWKVVPTSGAVKYLWDNELISYIDPSTIPGYTSIHNTSNHKVES